MFVRSVRITRVAGLLAAGLVAAAGLTACADNSDDEGSGAAPSSTVSVGAVQKDDALAAKVPEAIAKRGTFTVGTDNTYPPNEYVDGSGKTIGFDIDLFDAVAAKLGLKTEYQKSTFDNIIPSVEGGKYDVGVSSFTDNAEREQVVDFVTYFSAGTQWAAPAGKTVSPDDACGLTVAVQTGTVQDTDDLPARSKACTTAGKKAITVKKFDDQGLVSNAVALGQADAMLADSPITQYQVKQSDGKLQLAGDVYDAAPYGYAIGKNQGTLKDAVQGAVNALIKDGTYTKILDKWGLADGAITEAQINAASQS
ncbi:ABC transporter substrate-binding protein [Jatrophihabitans sp. YIM 134969]